MKTETPNIATPPAPRRSPVLVACIAVLLTAVYFAAVAWPRGDAKDGFHYREFARLPVHQGGRVMPLDTVARLSLSAMNHAERFTDDNKQRRSSIEFLLDTMISPPHNDKLLTMLFKQSQGGGPGYEHKVFRIDNDELLSILGIHHDQHKNPGFRYSFDEIRSAPTFDQFLQRAKRLLDENAPKSRTMTDNKVLELYQNLQAFYGMSSLQGPLAVPLDNRGDAWMSVSDGLQQALQGQQAPDAATGGYLKMLVAYRDGKPTEFNAALDDYQQVLQKEMPAVLSKARLETYFNEFAPFLHAAILDTLLFLLVCVAWLIRSDRLRWGAFAAAVVVLLVHSWAIMVRMHLMDRWMAPVTNLYSSAIFIGWGCAILCLGLEALFKNGIALAVGTVTGALSLLVAHLLGTDDTMGVLQAVLDTTFWLATHVVCITFGYTATFVAGFLAVAYILLGKFTRMLASDGAASLGKMIYGVLCFAMFLSFTGTVLGGIWADQSWGRFWGWDPKENGALLIVLWCALILHARWGGMIKQRGVAVLAVAGNIVTAWSWFGTNLLGVGLHAYGFMQGAFWGLALFDVLMLIIIAIGLTPQKNWLSFQRQSRDLTPAVA